MSNKFQITISKSQIRYKPSVDCLFDFSNTDKLVKVQIPIFRHSGESRARSETLALSSQFNMFWMPDQVRHDDAGTFYEFIN